MKKLQMLYGLSAVLIIVLGMVGCSMFDRDAAPPTSPANSSADLTPIGAGQLANFYVSDGVSDFYGVYVAQTSFVVNIPKPGAYLLTYSTKTGFGLSEESLENLELKGVPDDILASLKLLEDQTFTTEAAFLEAISAQIGDESAVMYEDLILRYSYASIGGPYFLAVQVKKNSLLYIGLGDGNELLNAAIDEGDATALAITSPDVQNFGSVVVLFRPGFIGTWMDYFIINPLIAQISLVSNSAIVISVNVIELQIPTKATRRTQKYTKPKTKKTKK